MIDLKIPRENANDDTVLINKIFFKNGDKVNKGDVLFEFETSKASIEFEAPEIGILYDFTITEGAQVSVDTIIGSIKKEAMAVAKNKKTIILSADNENNKNKDDINISNSANVLLKEGKQPHKSEKWLTTSNFQEGGEDESNISIPQNQKTTNNFNKRNILLKYSNLKINSRKQAEIKSLGITSEYFNSTLGVTVELNNRRTTNPFFKNSILDIVIYETSLLLKNKFSDLNACFLGNDEIGQFEKVIPGMAMDNLNNLTVASLPEFKTLGDLANEIIDIIVRFDAGKLKGKDLKNTTFTVTDLSTTGIDFILPLINGWQTFILGISKNKTCFNIFGTFDHRVTEGKRFAEFLIELKNRITLYELKKEEQDTGKHCFICMQTLEMEKEYGNRGLIKIDDGYGEKLICRNCFGGW